MKKFDTHMKIYGIAITVFLLLCCILLFLYIYDILGLQAWYMNLTTELLGSLLVLIVVDVVLRHKAEEDRKKRAVVAHEQLYLPILHHVQLLTNMYKSVLLNEPELRDRTLRCLFSDDFYVQLASLDFFKPAPIYQSQNKTVRWVDYTVSHFKDLQSKLDRIIYKYGVVLDTDIVDILEKLMNDNFAGMMRNMEFALPYLEEQGYQQKVQLLGGPGVAGSLRQHVESLLRLLTIINAGFPAEKQIGIPGSFFAHNAAPGWGTGRAGD